MFLGWSYRSGIFSYLRITRLQTLAPPCEASLLQDYKIILNLLI